MTRALATIEIISRIEPHPDADRLELAKVKGWTAIVGKGEFQAGETVIYIEEDAFLPEGDSRWDFLMARGVKTLPDGSRGHVLRTARIRGVISQGLVLKADRAWGELSQLDEVAPGADITDQLGITLYEPAVPITSDIIGPFPSGIRKTDEERIQNFTPERWDQLLLASRIDVTEKLDGSSVTIFVKQDGSMGVASRNWELNPECSTALLALDSGAARWLRNNGSPGDYLQGELFGPNIQGNPLRQAKVNYRVFSLGVANWTGTRFDPAIWSSLKPCKVPQVLLPSEADLDLEAAVSLADGMRSRINPDRQAEGVVIRGYSDDGVVQDSAKILNREALIVGHREPVKPGKKRDR